jgi:hypothetical protein
LVILTLLLCGILLGVPLRQAADRVAERVCRGRFAFLSSTLGVHVGGCAVLGFLIGLPAALPTTQTTAVLWSGVFVAYTIIGREAVRLIRGGDLVAPLVVAVQVMSGLAACLVGLAVAGVMPQM